MVRERVAGAREQVDYEALVLVRDHFSCNLRLYLCLFGSADHLIRYDLYILHHCKSVCQERRVNLSVRGVSQPDSTTSSPEYHLQSN